MEPVKGFLPKSNEQPNNILIEFSTIIDEFVNYGSHLFKWSLEKMTGSDEKLPLIMSLRHFLELIDSVSILIKSSSIDPCKTNLRAALESYFTMEYILEKDTHNRSMAFLVCSVHAELKSLEKLDNTSLQGIQLQKSLIKDKSLNNFKIPQNPDLKKFINNLYAQLSLPLYAVAETEYQRTVSIGNKNPNWFTLFNGPKNVEQLSEYLKRPSLYQLLYRNYSGVTHGTDIIRGKISATNNLLDIFQIRYPKEAQFVTSFALTFCQLTFDLFLNKILSDKKQNYKEWYLTKRDLYLSITGKEQLLKMV